MREIIFRGKPVERFKDFLWVRKDLFDELGFVHGSLFVDESGRTFICVDARCTHTTCIDNGSGTMIEVIPETVGQFTGLCDKNGKRIFTGDIVKHYYHCKVNEYSEDIGKVFYYPETFRLLRTSKLFPDDCPGIYRSCEYEIIGNIHSNPELLE